MNNSSMDDPDPYLYSPTLFKNLNLPFLKTGSTVGYRPL